MTVVIARDHRVFSWKWRDPIHNEKSRLETVQEAFPDARVILGDELDIFAPIRTLHPDILAFGYDQRVPEDRIRELFPHIDIVRIGGYETDRWKSSLLRVEKV
jgi:glycerol-3-phosphate cytidylyltransferase-like family protein